MKITFALLLMASAALTAKASLIPSSAASVDLDEVDTIKRLTERGQVLLVAQCLKGIKQRSLSLKRGILCRALIQSFVLKHQQTEPEILVMKDKMAVNRFDCFSNCLSNLDIFFQTNANEKSDQFQALTRQESDLEDMEPQQGGRVTQNPLMSETNSGFSTLKPHGPYFYSPSSGIWRKIKF